jgi:hypothetical protein
LRAGLQPRTEGPRSQRPMAHVCKLCSRRGWEFADFQPAEDLDAMDQIARAVQRLKKRAAPRRQGGGWNQEFIGARLCVCVPLQYS